MGKARHSAPGEGGKDPRDKVGLNPTGRETKSSAGRRRKAERRLDRDLEGTIYGDDPPPITGRTSW